MSDAKKVVIISGSPKAPGKAASDQFAEIAADAMGTDGIRAQIFNVRECTTKHTEQEAYAAMAEADAMIIIFPLYVFCLPGITMRFFAGLPQLRSGAENTQVAGRVRGG